MEMTEVSLDKEKLSEENKIDPEIKVYKKRWVILIIFLLCSASSVIQNCQYTVVANVVHDYYQVSYYAIDWTVMLASPLFIIFSFPGTYLLDILDLRKTMIIGIIGTAIGTWIKVAAVHPDRFWVVFLGHGIVTLFSICFIPILPKLAATWFGYKQIATATGLGLVGINAGTSLSFLVPTIILANLEVEKGLYTISLIYAIFTTVFIPIVIVFFSDKPKLPPSYAQKNYAEIRENNSLIFIKECKAIFSNTSFLIFAFICAINAASVLTLETLSNQVILYYYPDKELHVGIAGTLQVFFSLLGSIIGSIFLDKFKKFKITTWIVCGSQLIGLVLFSTTIHLGLPMVYISLSFIGFFFGTSEALHFEVVVELTYPQSQNVSIGVSSIIQRIMGLVFISLYGSIHRSIGNNWANITIICIVLCTNLLFFVMNFNLRRSEGEMKRSNKTNYK